MAAENSFVDWATIAGGVAGLVSAVFVAVEKFTKGPKIVCEIRKAFYKVSSHGCNFTVIFDIGNAGSEMTTLKKVFLEIDELSFRKQSYDVQKIDSRISFQIDDLRTQSILPGEAFVLNFKFYSSDEKIEKKALHGRLRLELLNQRDLVLPVELKNETFIEKEDRV